MKYTAGKEITYDQMHTFNLKRLILDAADANDYVTPSLIQQLVDQKSDLPKWVASCSREQRLCKLDFLWKKIQEHLSKGSWEFREKVVSNGDLVRLAVSRDIDHGCRSHMTMDELNDSYDEQL